MTVSTVERSFDAESFGWAMAAESPADFSLLANASSAIVTFLSRSFSVLVSFILRSLFAASPGVFLPPLMPPAAPPPPRPPPGRFAPPPPAPPLEPPLPLPPPRFWRSSSLRFSSSRFLSSLELSSSGPPIPSRSSLTRLASMERRARSFFIRRTSSSNLAFAGSSLRAPVSASSARRSAGEKLERLVG